MSDTPKRPSVFDLLLESALGTGNMPGRPQWTGNRMNFPSTWEVAVMRECIQRGYGQAEPTEHEIEITEQVYAGRAHALQYLSVPPDIRHDCGHRYYFTLKTAEDKAAFLLAS